MSWDIILAIILAIALGSFIIIGIAATIWASNNTGPQNNQNIAFGIAEKKKEFYFNFRAVKLLFEYLNQGKIELDRDFYSVRQKYINAISAARYFTKSNYSMFTADDMLRAFEQFYNSISFSYSVAHYNKEYLNNLIYQMDSFLKLGFDSTYLETVELESWFIETMNKMK